MIAALIIELSTDNFSIIEEQKIQIISLTISKKVYFPSHKAYLLFFKPRNSML